MNYSYYSYKTQWPVLFVPTIFTVNLNSLKNSPKKKLIESFILPHKVYIHTPLQLTPLQHVKYEYSSVDLFLIHNFC